MSGFALRWKGVFVRISSIPVAFLGVGLYRAWLATFFRFDTFPTIGFVDYAFFEGAIGIASLAIAFSARHITPLWSNEIIVKATAFCMVGGSILCALDCFILQSGVLKVVGLIIAGIGLGSLILMWAEFYGSLNPMRVALYHAAGIFFGELIIWLFTGLDTPYLVTLSLVLPLASISWVRRSLRQLPEVDRPRSMDASDARIVPWKPIALMAVCTFATGFGTFPEQPLVAGNIIGVFAVCALVFFGVLSASKWFNFDTIYQLAFPFMTVGLLLVASPLSSNPEVAAACYDAGYTMLSMFIMIVLSNITYRFGINAAWLNGIERGIRYLVEMLGWILFALTSTQLDPNAGQSVHVVVVVAVIAAFAVIFFTEKQLSAKWGISLRTGGGDDDPFAPGILAMRVSDLSKEYNLSPREEEVLQLLARKESVPQIEEDLFVAHGTVKAHTSRIYRKLGVHSKEELYILLEIDDENE